MIRTVLAVGFIILLLLPPLGVEVITVGEVSLALPTISIEGI